MREASTKFSIIGLGKLGYSMAVAIAKQGFDVIGVDINKEIVKMITLSISPVLETGVDELLKQNKSRFRATSSYSDAILNSSVTFVVVPSPSDENGAFSLKYISNAFRQIGKVLATKHEFHLVVLSSTVLPGSTRYGLLPILEGESGKKCGTDFGLCYSPEFIALGSVVDNFLNPDFTLIGESDRFSGDILERVYTQILEKQVPCRRMSFENAEVTKLALNSYVTAKITFANMIAALCEKIPGCDIDIISDALALDSRIGGKYLTGAIGYGGPCFPRDNLALDYIAAAMGCRLPLPREIDNYNRLIPTRIVERLATYIPSRITIGVLGLAYKPYTPVTEESQGVYIATSLAQKGYRVLAYDPLVIKDVKVGLPELVELQEDLSLCIAQSEAIVITTPDSIFQSLSESDFPHKNPPIVVLDCWRILKKLSICSHIRYIPVGIGLDDDLSQTILKRIWYQP